GEGEGEGGTIIPIDPADFQGISLLFVLLVSALAGVLAAGVGDRFDSDRCFLTSLLEGAPLEDTLKDFRLFRDNYLRKFLWGRSCIWIYYRLGPALCKACRFYPGLRRPALYGVGLLARICRIYA
ncbi:MAG TPA: hypothetical protein PKO36_10115, partial [Candidatus Hydrogenedentes bacterium]|nr:hypothetical protein [Candidatus Hydrogenedentota bacterium]